MEAVVERNTIGSDGYYESDNTYNNDDDSVNDESAIKSIRDRIWMAPMVRGSDLAFRSLMRQEGRIATTCFSPMIRADQVLKACDYYMEQQSTTCITLSQDTLQQRHPLHEDAILVLTDILSDNQPLIVQLCGCQPDVLYQACRRLLRFNTHPSHHECHIVGLDLNLGCPQECARVGHFGAFLAEERPDVALACVAAMRRAIDDHIIASNGMMEQSPRLSCKIRLHDTTQETIDFARQLQQHGCEMLSIHCRRRQDKHDGMPDYEAGRQLVGALQERHPNFPVLINGGVKCMNGAKRVLQKTKAAGVMIARGFLNNPLLLVNTTITNAKNETIVSSNAASSSSSSVLLAMAARYVDYAEQQPPPSPLYIRKHLQWLFRDQLRPKTKFEGFDDGDWKSKLWTFLQRPYLESPTQFRCVLGLYARHKMMTTSSSETTERVEIPPSLTSYCSATFRDIRYGRVPGNGDGGEDDAEQFLGANFFAGSEIAA